MTTVVPIFKQVSEKIIRPEVDLLLCCARTCLNEEIREKTKKILHGDDFDWNYFTEIATYHGVTPLFYKNVHDICPELFPNHILLQFQKTSQTNASHNLFLTQQLVKIIDLFTAHHIPVIPYKGVVLATLAYQNLTLRQCSDIDILVERQDLLKARELLMSQGYLSSDSLSKEELDNIFQFAQGHAWQMSHSSYSHSVDLHWTIIPNYFVGNRTSELFQEKLQSISLANRSVITFNPSNLLVILCLHGTVEGWRQLKRCCDIAELIYRCEIDWHYAIEQAIKLNCQRELLVGLLIANQLLDANLPEEMQKLIEADSLIRWFKPRLREWMFPSDGSSYGFQTRFFYILMRKGLWNRVKYAFSLATATNNQDIFPVFFLNLPFRLFRLIQTYKLSFGRISLLLKSIIGR
jgi:hypothetical protein